MTNIKKVMSIAIVPELQESLKKFSKRRGLSISGFICNLLEQAVKLNVDDDPMVIGKPADEDILPVLLKIPANLKGNPDKLKQWLDIQVAGIMKAMTEN